MLTSSNYSRATFDVDGASSELAETEGPPSSRGRPTSFDLKSHWPFNKMSTIMRTLRNLRKVGLRVRQLRMSLEKLANAMNTGCRASDAGMDCLHPSRSTNEY